MSEFFITGKPRGGKTFLAVKFLYEVLLREKDTRPIMTNCSLNLQVIAEELARDLKLDYVPDLTKRIRMLDEVETGEFWLHSLDKDGNKVDFFDRRTLKMRSWQMEIPDFKDRGTVGAWYFIDEIHIYFPATFSVGESREKVSMDNDLRFFLSQHGKMNIDIICITQHVEQTSKILRRLAQEYMHVRNLSREPYLGFRVGNLFRYVRSLNSPASANPAPFESGFHSMDFKKYGKMFDTTAGVGIAGTFIRDQPKRGRSLLWVIPCVLAFFVFLWWLVFKAPEQSKKLANKISAGATNHLLSKKAGAAALGVLTTNEAPVSAPVVSPGVPVSSGVNSQATNVVSCVGWTCVGGRWTVFLSDGRAVRGMAVQRITEDGATIAGRFYPLAPITVKPESSGPWSGASSWSQGPVGDYSVPRRVTRIRGINEVP